MQLSSLMRSSFQFVSGNIPTRMSICFQLLKQGSQEASDVRGL